MSEKFFKTMPREEVSFKDVTDFIAESWKITFFFGFLGVICAVIFLLITPKEYEAIAQIQVAQIATSNTNTSPLGANIEDPSFLITRLKIPTNYSDKEIKACGIESIGNPFEALTNSAKFSVVKGAGSMIELKINRKDKELAFFCANALFEAIKESQVKIIIPYVNEAKILLEQYQARLSNAQSLVARADKSGAALSAAYLANRDEVKFLTEEIMRLNTFITSFDTRKTKLVSPIYVSDLPVYPKNKSILLVGIVAGLLSGILLVMCKKFVGLKK